MEDTQESTDEAIPEVDNNMVEETQSSIIDLERSSAASASSASNVESTCTPARKSLYNKRKKINSISILLEENKKAREKILETFVNKTDVAQEDDVDLFYRSIAVSVKRLPPHLIAQAKLEHLQIVNKLQLLASQPKDLLLPQTQVERSPRINLYEDQNQNDELRYFNLE